MKVLLTTFAMLALSMVCLPLAMSGQREPTASMPGAAGGSADTYFLTPPSRGMQFEVDSGNAMGAILISTGMTSVDRMPRDGHAQHILHSPGGRLCGS